MKVLHIVRHAEAVRRRPQRPDFKRALTKKGVKTARTGARRLRKGGLTADYMISSPAIRALETARVFAKELKYSVKKIERQKMIYDAADNDALLSLVRAIPAKASDAFLFGHDPSFSDFAQHLIEGLDQSMPKGAVVTVGFETESWEGAGPGCARLLRFDYPMSKREKERRIESVVQELASSLSSAMSKPLQGLDPRTAEKLRAYVFKRHASKKMRKVAQRFVELAPRIAPATPKDTKAK